MLPPFVAEPVLRDRPATVHEDAAQSTTDLNDNRETIAPQQKRDIVRTPGSKATTRLDTVQRETVIEKNTPVIIDLNTQRVTVGRPVL